MTLEAPRHDQIYVRTTDHSIVCFFGKDGSIYKREWNGYQLEPKWQKVPLVGNTGELDREALDITLSLNNISGLDLLTLEVPLEPKQVSRLFGDNIPLAMREALAGAQQETPQ
jgi:hypothetical protein